MSYAIYTTKGFVLGSAPSGEASKMYTLYTEDFGLVHAKAQGVRLLVSKLRYNLEEYSFATFSLVKGREVWRLTGVEQKTAKWNSAHMRARVLSLIRRLVHGEEKNERLFATLTFMMEGSGIQNETPDDVIAFESLVLINVLSALGYIDSQALIGVSGDKILSLDNLSLVKAKKREVISEINRALKETQL